MTSPSNPTATRVAGIAVSDAHRYRTAIEAAQHAGIPDRLIAAAFHLGQNAHDDNSPETDQDAPDDFNTTAYDNILAVAYSAAEGWTTDAMMRVLTAHEHAGHRNVPVGLVLRDLTRALAPVERWQIRAVQYVGDDTIEILAPWGEPMVGQPGCFIAEVIPHQRRYAAAQSYRYPIDDQVFEDTYVRPHGP